MNMKKPGRANVLTELEKHRSDASILIINSSDRAYRDLQQAHDVVSLILADPWEELTTAGR